MNLKICQYYLSILQDLYLNITNLCTHRQYLVINIKLYIDNVRSLR